MIDINWIAASNETLFRQAPMTAHDYMLKAIGDIDELLGKGYAKQHPELIAAYMQTAAIDLSGSIIARAIEGVERALGQIADAAWESKTATVVSSDLR
jgi:hypothetical protein